MYIERLPTIAELVISPYPTIPQQFLGFKKLSFVGANQQLLNADFVCDVAVNTISIRNNKNKLKRGRTVIDSASFQYYPNPIMFNASVASKYTLIS